LANLTTDDLVSIRSLPPAIAIHGNDVIPLGQLIEGADEDRGGTVNQLIALIIDLIPPSPGGGGITWTEYTAAATLVANTGAIANSTNTIKFTLPAGEIGDLILVQGSGSEGLWQVIDGTITLPDGTQDTGIRQLDTHLFAGVELLCLSPGIWVVRNPFNLVGIELFTDFPPGTVLLSELFDAAENSAIALKFPNIGQRWEKLASYSSDGIILGGVAANPTGENNLLLASNILTASNYTVSADFTTTISPGSVSLIVRAGTPLSSQAIVISLLENKVYIEKGINEENILSQDNFVLPASGNILISVAATQVTVNINSGAYTKTIVSSDYNTNTQVGFGLLNDGFTIDNIQVLTT
jgi:hypothetical protein